MPKPTTLPDWATDAAYPAGAEPEATTATKVAPTTGQETIGWRPDQIPTAQEMNYWMNLVGEWIEYLDAAIFDGDVIIDGNLHVRDIPAAGLLGNLDVDSVATLAYAVVENTLTVGGDVTLGTDIFSDTVQINAVATFGDAPIAPYYRFTDEEVIRIPFYAAVPFVDETGASGLRLQDDGWVVPDAALGGLALNYPVIVPSGVTIVSWTVYVYKEKGAGTTITAELIKVSGVGPGRVETPIHQNDDPLATTVDTTNVVLAADTLTLTTNHTTSGGDDAYILRVSSDVADNGEDFYGNAEIRCTRP